MSEFVDMMVRQILGNTGAVNPKEYQKAVDLASENARKGLFPTTGGAVSLMHRELVEFLWRKNDGPAGFTPKVPDEGGERASGLEEWYVAAIEQALFHRSSGLFARKGAFNPALVNAMDGFLHTYHGAGVDWERVYEYSKAVDRTVPPFGKPPFWMTYGDEPMSVLAFCGERVRAGAPRR